MLTVCATRVDACITPFAGYVDLCYSIGIEQNTAGTIEYYLSIQSK